jgi:hypothetical protein
MISASCCHGDAQVRSFVNAVSLKRASIIWKRWKETCRRRVWPRTRNDPCWQAIYCSILPAGGAQHSIFAIFGREIFDHLRRPENATYGIGRPNRHFGGSTSISPGMSKPKFTHQFSNTIGPSAPKSFSPLVHVQEFRSKPQILKYSHFVLDSWAYVYSILMASSTIRFLSPFSKICLTRAHYFSAISTTAPCQQLLPWRSQPQSTRYITKK